ncbi:hypothetical protein SFR_5737 [Streptomyces sp. FR-008]|nr:hypothetical protein SFR_5737 [Streptomyces sp. FR-008]
MPGHARSLWTSIDDRTRTRRRGRRAGAEYT